MLDTTSRPRVFSVDTIENDLFEYDLGFGEQQLIPNSQVITNSSQTRRDFPKQIPLNPTTSWLWLLTMAEAAAPISGMHIGRGSEKS